MFSSHYSVFRELTEHIQAFYLSDIISPTLSLKLSITGVQFCPSLFFLYLGEGGRRWGRQRKDGLIAPRMDFSLLFASNNKPRKFYILKACLLASASPETKKMLSFRWRLLQATCLPGKIHHFLQVWKWLLRGVWALLTCPIYEPSAPCCRDQIRQFGPGDSGIQFLSDILTIPRPHQVKNGPCHQLRKLTNSRDPILVLTESLAAPLSASPAWTFINHQWSPPQRTLETKKSKSLSLASASHWTAQPVCPQFTSILDPASLTPICPSLFLTLPPTPPTHTHTRSPSHSSNTKTKPRPKPQHDSAVLLIFTDMLTDLH